MALDIAQLEAHRPALTGHCYRMLGSAFDAEDAVQETIIRAWRNLERFEGRASLRTWLYRIATNVCLDALADRTRRARPIEEGPVGTVDALLEPQPRTHWLEPIADVRALPADANPHELTVLRQSIRLAFVAALQHLPPRQRAALLLVEVLGWSAVEAAECLEMSTAAFNSALQRARATLASRNISLDVIGDEDVRDAGLSEEEATLLDRYLDAFERYDIDSLVSLLREDATLSMPPYTLWLRGRQDIRTWLLGRGIECRGSRMVATAANGMRAFAQYRPSPGGGHHAWALTVLELDGGRIAAWNAFLDVESLFPYFGLPMTLPADRAASAASGRERHEPVTADR
jgi:RNA polymerase sigma-70 factor (ECF subfamily)